VGDKKSIAIADQHRRPALQNKPTRIAMPFHWFNLGTGSRSNLIIIKT